MRDLRAALLLTLVFAPVSTAQIGISNGEDVNFNFGLLAQAWGDWNQTAAPGGLAGYQQNLYLRRIRLLFGEKFTTIPKQNDYLVEAAYYSHRIKLQPFGKFESQAFVDPSAQAKDVYRWGGGVNYYVHSQNLKFTAQWRRPAACD